MVKVQNVFFQHGQLYLELFENPRCAIADRVGCFGRGDLHLTANLTQQPSGRLMVTTGSHDMLMCFIGVIKRNDFERFVGPVTSFTRPMRWSGTFTPLSFRLAASVTRRLRFCVSVTCGTLTPSAPVMTG